MSARSEVKGGRSKATGVRDADSPRVLTHASYARALGFLAESDRRLARVLDEFGAPPTWFRAPGFSTLVYIVLEQQVSLASARAAYERLNKTISPLTPRRFLSLDSRTLKKVGFSRQKTEYCRGLARAVLGGRLDLAGLGRLGDEEAKTALMRHKGIGRWSADIYLVHALRRPDAWPVTDLALATAAVEVLELESRPTADDLEAIGEIWRPWRSVAARLLWHAYLCRRNGSGPRAM
jgi:DNA-3-methyladenine glycosylase II